MHEIFSKILSNECCRLCNSSNIDVIFDFGFIPLGNNLQRDLKRAIQADDFPLVVCRCINCGHFQLGHSVAKEMMYALNYTYLSGIGEAFLRHIKDYVKWIKKTCNLKNGNLVLDIGSNDGTCLSIFKEEGLVVQGIDPAELPVKIANKKNIPTIHDFFNRYTASKLIDEIGYVDLVTSQNVLAHVENLRECFESVYNILKPNGYLVFEVGYFLEVLRSNCFDTIYHEHIDYHHANPLALHLSSLGFDILDLSVNSIQGGSLRVLAKKTGKGKISFKAQKFLNNEKNSILYDTFFLNEWMSNIKLSMMLFNKRVVEYRNRGYKIVGYGAPTKATLLLSFSGLSDNIVDFICEDNKFKVGRYLPKTSIIIRATSYLDEFISKNNCVIIIFAWNFADDIIKKLKSRISHPITIIIPLPKLKILNL